MPVLYYWVHHLPVDHLCWRAMGATKPWKQAETIILLHIRAICIVYDLYMLVYLDKFWIQIRNPSTKALYLVGRVLYQYVPGT